MKNSNIKPAFNIKGSLITFIILQLLSVDIEKIDEEIINKNKTMPNFLITGLTMIIDLQNVENILDEFFLFQLNNLLKKRNILPIYYIYENKKIKTYLNSKNLVTLEYNKINMLYKKEKEQNLKQSHRTMVVDKRVRSGQQIVSHNSDIVICDSVSHGAEIISSGNIHVYGTLRGKAIAGYKGDITARIFCQQLEASLISIAGQYKILEEDKKLEPHSGCQIRLKNDKILINGFKL